MPCIGAATTTRADGLLGGFCAGGVMKVELWRCYGGFAGAMGFKSGYKE